MLAAVGVQAAGERACLVHQLLDALLAGVERQALEVTLGHHQGRLAVGGAGGLRLRDGDGGVGLAGDEGAMPLGAEAGDGCRGGRGVGVGDGVGKLNGRAFGP